MPQPSTQGVFGMARTTGTSRPSAFSIWLVGTDAATEMINCLLEMLGRICSITSCTTCGFTQTKMMSAARAAARLSVPTVTPSFSVSVRARDSCWTVAKVALGESRPFSNKALSRIPPILPAPSTATRFPERSNPIRLPSPGRVNSTPIQISNSGFSCSGLPDNWPGCDSTTVRPPRILFWPYRQYNVQWAEKQSQQETERSRHATSLLPAQNENRPPAIHPAEPLERGRPNHPQPDPS